jgi:hypothetical protein
MAIPQRVVPITRSNHSHLVLLRGCAEGGHVALRYLEMVGGLSDASRSLTCSCYEPYKHVIVALSRQLDSPRLQGGAEDFFNGRG